MQWINPITDTWITVNISFPVPLCSSENIFKELLLPLLLHPVWCSDMILWVWLCLERDREKSQRSEVLDGEPRRLNYLSTGQTNQEQMHHRLPYCEWQYVSSELKGSVKAVKSVPCPHLFSPWPLCSNEQRFAWYMQLLKIHNPHI